MANNSRDLNFIIGALDRSEKAFAKISAKVDRLQRKLDQLDGKTVKTKVDVDTKQATSKLRSLGDITASATAGAIRVTTSNIHILIGIVAAALLALPAVGALAGVGIAFGFGAALAGVGLAAAAQSKEVKERFAELKKDLGRDLKEAAKPFIGVFEEVDRQARRAFKALDLDTIFGRIAPALDRFIGDLGDGFVKLAPALKPLTDAFTDILGELGPELPGLFGEIGTALSTLGRSVSENKDVLAGFVLILLRSIPRVIEFVALLVRLFPRVLRGALLAFSAIAPVIANTVIPALRVLAEVVLSVFGLIVAGAAKAFGWVPGVGPKLKKAAAEFPAFKDSVIGALDDAQAKANEWSEAAAKMAQEIKLRSDISDLETKLRTAKRQLKDPTLTKDQVKRIKGNITHLEDQLAAARAELAGLKPPTIKQIKGHIKDLEAKLASAKRQLRNPALTKPQEKKLRGNIRDLEAKIRQAKRALAGVRNRTVYIFGRWSIPPAPNAGNMLNAALGRRAAGGPALAGRSYLVGERGPELLTMGRGGSGVVTPNRQLSELGGGDTTVNVFIGDEQLRDIVRSEVVSSNRDTKRRAQSGAGGAR